MSGASPQRRCARFVVTGRVQGVFFRAGTQATARGLSLTGWVRNNRDGSVELVACGEGGTLDRLESWLWQGPGAARVDAVHRRPAADEGYADFAVRYDG